MTLSVNLELFFSKMVDEKNNINEISPLVLKQVWHIYNVTSGLLLFTSDWSVNEGLSYHTLHTTSARYLITFAS